VLLLLFEAFDAPLPVISGTALVLCAGWLGWTRRLKGEYLRALASNLSDPDPGQSGDALAALSRLGAAEAMPVLLEHLQADDEEMTWLALELLEHIEDPAVPARLAAYLDRVDAPRQRALLGTLERRRDASTLAQIQPLLASDQPSVRAAAARAMRSLGAPASHLDGLLKDPDVGVRAEAVAALLAVADLRATAELMRLTTSGDDRSRERAAYVLGQAGGTGRLDLLTRLCADSVAAVRRSCAAALVQVGGQQAAALLVEMVDDPQAGSAALDGLVEMGPVALDAMAQRWDEVDSAVRTNLALCLSKMSGDAVHAFLIQRLAGEQESVQEACIEALAVLGNLPSDAVPPLEQALRTSVARLQRLSAWAVDLADLAPAMLLHDALLRRAAQAEKVALRCVELLGPARQVQVAVANLKSPVARLRAEALEVLEGACSAARVLVQELERRYLHPQSSGQGEPRRALEALARIELTSWERACLYYALQQAGYQDLATDLDFKEVQNMAGNIERILFLKSASLFADVAGSDLPWIDEIAREHTYPAGEVIFRENEMGDTLYIIVEGQVRVLKGEEAVTLAVLQERDCFGEMAILDGEPRSATVETMREARLLEIAREDFNQLLLARPQIGFALIKNLNRRLRQTNAKLIEKEA
jgi:HEAT repeat protein